MFARSSSRSKNGDSNQGRFRRSAASIPREGSGGLRAEDGFQALLQRLAECLAGGPLGGSLNPLREEASDPQPLRGGLREPAAAQVVELLGVDLRDRCRVGAAHVVGFDLEAGN